MRLALLRNVRRSIHCVVLAALATLYAAPSPFQGSMHFNAAAAATLPNESPSHADTTTPIDTTLDEMLIDAAGQRHHWPSTPRLVVLTSVMEYHTGESSQYSATAEQVSAEDAQGLVDDLTSALGLLTTGKFEQFATVEYEAAPAGTSVSIVRPNQIVVGRFKGVRRLANTIGFGGRRARRDGAIFAAAVVLDSEFDHASSKRRLLRTHELGHALGFNHVKSRVSIMNPTIGSEMTDHDRQVSMFAFHRPGARPTE